MQKQIFKVLIQILKGAEKTARSSGKLELLAVLASQRGLEPPAPRLGVRLSQ